MAIDKIQLLPDSVANQIAAGEVVQNPSSIIKELVENAVDAGATVINVLVEGAGKTSVQVIDNGIGMSVTDARLAFERHATSKIRKAEDLFTLHTMGFRGEALPSIAAVAQVTLQTRQADDAIGTKLCLAGGKKVTQEPIACQQGCNFLVENLFYNTPARRRFFRSDATEQKDIVTAFLRIALVYPEIEFTLHSNGQQTYNLPASSTHQRILNIFGKKLNQQLLPVEVDTSICKITGFVGQPTSAHKKNVQQFFFVNGRYMKHAYFQKAIANAYDRLIPQGDQVPFFIYFTVDPQNIDVNIHPTKTQIKFHDERAVWDILSASVRDAIGKFCNITAIDFDTEGRPDIPIFDGTEAITSPEYKFNPQYNPFNSSPSTAGGSMQSAMPQGAGSSAASSAKSGGGSTVNSQVDMWRKTTKIQSNWQALYEGLENTDSANVDAMSDQQELNLFDSDRLNAFADGVASPDVSAMPTTNGNSTDANSEAAGQQQQSPEAMQWSGLMQYKGSYIITSVPSGLMIVNQERAHERVLYERYVKQIGNRKRPSQQSLFPEQVQFTISEMMFLPTILPKMEAMGFELADCGGGFYEVRATPAGLEGINIAHLVSDMVASACENTDDDSDSLSNTLAATMARNAAIPPGQVLSPEEMQAIITELLLCGNYNYTPSGKAIYTIIPHANITKLIG